MPRRARWVVPGLPMHILQRAVNHQTCFPEPGDHDLYVRLLEEATVETSCRIHAYVVMTNHVHILATPDRVEAPAAMMKKVGQIYSQYFNRKYRRVGTLWASRPKTCHVQDAAYLMNCYRYIELNPVRAGMVRNPGDYQWSSYRANALVQPSWISPHVRYLELGPDRLERSRVYLDFVERGCTQEELQAIRIATRCQTTLGDEDFVRRLEAERKHVDDVSDRNWGPSPV